MLDSTKLQYKTQQINLTHKPTMHTQTTTNFGIRE